MTALVESPWPAIAFGVIAEVILAIVLLRTGRASVLVGMALVALITAGLLVAELAIVTQREEIETVLDLAATRLEANDPPQVLQLVSPRSPRRGEIESILAHITVRDARITSDVEVRTNRLTSPPSAKAFFIGRVEANDKRGAVPYEQFIGRFAVTLHRDGDRWLIYDYDDDDPDTRGRGRPRGQ